MSVVILIGIAKKPTWSGSVCLLCEAITSMPYMAYMWVAGLSVPLELRSWVGIATTSLPTMGHT
jgi:hypothetical protein